MEGIIKNQIKLYKESWESMGIAAAVIWYNPDKNNILNIKSYIDYIEKLYIIDNSREDHQKLLKELENLKIDYIFNGKNLGIAKALNIACDKAKTGGYNWILTMDQDSSFNGKIIKQYLKIFRYTENKEVGIISPLHLLKNDIRKIDEKKIFIKTDNVMTSGNFLNLDIWEKIGKFDETLFIDEVDSDFCYRLTENKYKILQLNKIEMFHELGNLEKRRFFTKKISILNHNYIRKYYITRNRFYMLKKYKKYRKRYIYYILNDFFKVILYERDKKRKLTYMFRGMNDFFHNKMGELNDSK